MPDILTLPHPLRRRKTRVWSNQGYLGQTEAIRTAARRAADFTSRKYRFPGGRIDEAEKARNRTKSKVRAKVEHPIGVI